MNVLLCKRVGGSGEGKRTEEEEKVEKCGVEGKMDGDGMEREGNGQRRSKILSTELGEGVQTFFVLFSYHLCKYRFLQNK